MSGFLLTFDHSFVEVKADVKNGKFFEVNTTVKKIIAILVLIVAGLIFCVWCIAPLIYFDKKHPSLFVLITATVGYYTISYFIYKKSRKTVINKITDSDLFNF